MKIKIKINEYHYTYLKFFGWIPIKIILKFQNNLLQIKKN